MSTLELNETLNYPDVIGAGHSIAIACMLVAMVCVIADQYALSDRKQPTDGSRLWRWCAALLLLMAVDSLLRGEHLLIWWLRELARSEGWYGLRRPIQLLALSVIVPLGALAVSRVRRSLSHRELQGPQRLAIGGMVMLLALLSLRLVSYHYTDQMLAMRLASVSVGRWLDASALLAVALGALGKIARTYTYRS